MENILILSWTQCDMAGRLDLLVLLILSIASWGLMFEKLIRFRRIDLENAHFEEEFKTGILPESSSLFSSIAASILPMQGLSQEEFYHFYESFAHGLLERLEKHLSFLASVVVVSPFLGLLGAVWGLLLAFRNISASGSSSISVVASGVAEALFTTVVGLLVAIPAAIGHNYLAAKVKFFARKLEQFSPFLYRYSKGNNNGQSDKKL